MENSFSENKSVCYRPTRTTEGQTVQVNLTSEEDTTEFDNEMGKVFKNLKSWSYYVIPTLEDVDQIMDIPFQKKRKLYNGMLKSYYYQYLGPRPQK